MYKHFWKNIFIFNPLSPREKDQIEAHSLLVPCSHKETKPITTKVRIQPCSKMWHFFASIFLVIKLKVYRKTVVESWFLAKV